MGACGSTLSAEEQTARKASRQIDSLLREHGRLLADEVKILLLGMFQISQTDTWELDIYIYIYIYYFLFFFWRDLLCHALLLVRFFSGHNFFLFFQW
jgi:hypothetical protein